MNNIILEQLNRYKPINIGDYRNAFKEILQNNILNCLGKTDFFKKAVFYGGTSLRIFRNLPRFSEDLYFTLIKKDDDFELKNYIQNISKYFLMFGISCNIQVKEKNVKTAVESCYIKFNFRELLLLIDSKYQDQVNCNEVLSIKIEIEKNSFDGGVIESKLLTYPSFAQVKTYSLETLFASKLIAILNRKWQTRVKGRDFYDYLFYISNNVKVNLNFLENGLKKFGYLSDGTCLTIEFLREELIKRFESIDFNDAKKDVIPFIRSGDVFIESFNKDIFISSVELIEAL